MKFIDSLFYFFGKFKTPVNDFNCFDIIGFIFVVILLNLASLLQILIYLNLISYEVFLLPFIFGAIFTPIFLFFRYRYKSKYEDVIQEFVMMEDNILTRYKIANVVYLILTVTLFIYFLGIKHS